MWPLIERAVRYAHAAYVDFRLNLTGKAEPDVPPIRLQFVGAGDFRAAGEHLLHLTLTYGRVTPDSRLLDIGCGSGRLAIPLTHYLSAGAYEGFDIVGSAVRWCRRNVTPRFPNFRFKHVRLKSSLYSVRGGPAARFVFPYDQSHFDCVVAYSLFTHLQFEEIRNYLTESYRVLSPGGILISTFFLLNEQSESAQKALPQVQQFPHEEHGVRIASKSNPAFAVAIKESVLRQLLQEAGFRKVTVAPGGWYGLQETPTFQDLVICEK